MTRPASSIEVRTARPGSPRAVSLADVAQLAGVSPGTVSRALSKPGMISDATRQRVLVAAERLGYVANGAARALAMRKTKSVGALVPRFGGSSFPTLVQALETQLAEQGYTLLLSAPDHARYQVEAPAILRALLERGVDALALLGAEQSPAVFGMLAAHRLPFVLLWAEQSPHGTCVGFDEQAAAALVVDHLADHGHRRIGFIGGRTADNERARRRFSGLLQAVARRGLTLVQGATLEAAYGFREGFEAMQAVLAKSEAAPPTAMVCGNDYLAAGALSALDQAGVAVPAQMSVASFNDNDFAAFLHPPLTTVRVPIRRMGEVAGQHLLAQLQGEMPAPPAPLPLSLVVRGSTGPCIDPPGSVHAGQ
jgi:LacI family transcriptional regulator